MKDLPYVNKTLNKQTAHDTRFKLKLWAKMADNLPNLLCVDPASIMTILGSNK